jgi:hypothetical protein
MFDISYKSFDEPELAEIHTSSSDTTPRQTNYSVDKPFSKRVKFQINTDPVKCDVYINDELIGSSPISWWVDRNTVHVVQVKAEGYRTGIRILPPEEMINQEKVIVIMRLDPLTILDTSPVNLQTTVTNPVGQVQDTTRIDSMEVTISQ